MPRGVEAENLTIGKFESLLHIVDIIRGLDARMEMQMLAIFLYVARHGMKRRDGITMDEIATEIGIAQSSISRAVLKLSDGILNPARDTLEKAAKKRVAPTREQLKPKYGIGLLYTQDDPTERRRKVVFLTPMGERIAHQLADYTVASYPMDAKERRKRVRDMRRGKDVENMQRLSEYEEKYMHENFRRLEELQDQLKKQYESVRQELSYRTKDMNMTFSQLRKKNLLSSGFMREGANTKPRRKTLLEEGGKKK